MEKTGHQAGEYHGTETGHRREGRTGSYGKADGEGRREQPDRHITTNYAQQANIVCIHNATLNKTTLLGDR
jgi:hypothetical protein